MAYRFKLGDRVHVLPARKDLGGDGEVTGRETKEDDRGMKIMYRVKIDGNQAQAELATRKGRVNLGFWYDDDLVGVE